MATPEFEQTGSTSGQRLAAANATEPPEKRGRPPKQGIDVSGGLTAASNFVGDFLDRNPASVPAPTADPFPDLSEADMAQLVRRLNNAGVTHTMSAAQAEQISPLLEP